MMGTFLFSITILLGFIYCIFKVKDGVKVKEFPVGTLIFLVLFFLFLLWSES